MGPNQNLKEHDPTNPAFPDSKKQIKKFCSQKPRIPKERNITNYAIQVIDFFREFKKKANTMVETKSFDEQASLSVPLVDASPVSTARSVPPEQSKDTTGSANNEEEEEEEVKRRMVASGTTGAVVGFLFGGPILSALLGFGAAYVSKKQGPTGDAARALGDVGVSIRDKAVEIDEKHRVVERSTKAANDAWESAKKYDQQHHVLDKAWDFAVKGWQSFVSYVEKNRLLERGVEGVGKGYEYVAEKVGGSETATK